MQQLLSSVTLVDSWFQIIGSSYLAKITIFYCFFLGFACGRSEMNYFVIVILVFILNLRILQCETSYAIGNCAALTNRLKYECLLKVGGEKVISREKRGSRWRRQRRRYRRRRTCRIRIVRYRCGRRRRRRVRRFFGH